MEVLCFLPCEQFQRGQVYNIIGIANDLTPRSYPASGPVSFAIIIQGNSEDAASTHSLELVAIDADGKLLNGTRSSFAFRKSPTTSEAVWLDQVPLMGVVYPKPGVYQVELRVDGRVLATQYLDLGPCP